MTGIVCDQGISEGRRQAPPLTQAQQASKSGADRPRSAKPKYMWRPEYDAYLKVHYFGGLNRRFQVLNRMQIHLAVIRARAVLVSTRTALVNATRGLTKSYGERLRKCGTGH